MNKQELIKRLWSLWENLAEAGEIHIGIGFSEKYDEIEKEVEKQFQSQPEPKKSAGNNLLSEALKNFTKQYPSQTSGHIQAFILGFKAMQEYAQQLPQKKRKLKSKIDRKNCAHEFTLQGDIFRCKKCKCTIGQWMEDGR